MSEPASVTSDHADRAKRCHLFGHETRTTSCITSSTHRMACLAGVMLLFGIILILLTAMGDISKPLISLDVRAFLIHSDHVRFMCPFTQGHLWVS